MSPVVESEIVRVIRAFKAAVLADEEAQVARLALAYLDVEHALADNIAALSEQLARLKAEGQEVPFWKLLRLERWQRLQAQTLDEIARFNGWAVAQIADEQLRLGILGMQHAAQAAETARPGISAMLDRLPRDAFRGMVGLAGDGSPLSVLLAKSGPAVREAMLRELLRSIALGRNPKVTAAAVRKATGMGLQRAVTIARTEQLRCYREATMASYRAMGVTQYQRIATQDERTCFPAGTLVQTQSGEVPIEMVTPGAVVLSGKREWRAVSATMARLYDGQMTEVRTVLGAGFVSTSNHPVLVEREGKLDWVAAGRLKVGDAVVSCAESDADLGDHRFGDWSIERRVCDAHDQVPATDEAQRLAPVGVGALVPIDAVDFERDVQVRQVEVNRVAVKTRLLNELDPEHAEAAAHVRLRFCLPGVAAVTRRTAELLKRHGRNDAEVLAALETGVDHGRAPTEFGAIAASRATASEDLAAPRASRVQRVPRPAFSAAVLEAVGDAGIDSEVIAARRASLGHLPRRGGKFVAGARAIQVAFGRTVKELRAALQAGLLLPIPLSYAHALAAAVEIPGGGFDLGSPAPVRDAAYGANEFDAAGGQFRLHTDIVSHVANLCHGVVPVYNLEVAEDHTYFAGGVLVHNCIGCAVADGEILSTEAEFDEHVCGRCSLIPIIPGVENPVAEAMQSWFDRQSEATQLSMMGPGRYAAYKSGAASWRDMATHVHDPQWGGAFVPTPVSQLLAAGKTSAAA